MNINKFTIKSQEALQQAQQIAQSFGQQQLENEHLFKGILEVDENVTPFILKKLNVNVELFKKVLLTSEKIFYGIPNPPLTPSKYYLIKQKNSFE